MNLASLFLAAFPTARPATPPAPERIAAFTAGARVLFIGDSITDWNRGRNADPNHILGHGYVFIIAARQGAAFPELRLDFINRGVSGNTVLDMDKRWQTDALDLRPDALGILIGVNDQSRGVPRDEYERVYDRLITRARAMNRELKLVLGEPFWKPTGRLDGGSASDRRSSRGSRRSTARRSCGTSVSSTRPRSVRPRTTGSGTPCTRPTAAISSWPTSGSAWRGSSGSDVRASGQRQRGRIVESDGRRSGWTCALDFTIRTSGGSGRARGARFAGANAGDEVIP